MISDLLSILKLTEISTFFATNSSHGISWVQTHGKINWIKHISKIMCNITDLI